MTMIKKIVSLALTTAMLVTLSGCGKKSEEKQSSIVGDGVDVTEPVKTIKPEFTPETSPEAAAETTDIPDFGSGATQEPFVDSGNVTNVTANEIPVAEDEKDFENKDDTAGFKKYVGGDKVWGILLPENAVTGDEDVSGSIFMLGTNMIAVSTVDGAYEFVNPETAKRYFSIIDDVNVNSFTVIYDGDKYAGCCFDFQTSVGAWGFCKYAYNKGKGAAAVAMNMEDDASLNEVLRTTVNSLVVLD